MIIGSLVLLLSSCSVLEKTNIEKKEPLNKVQKINIGTDVSIYNFDFETDSSITKYVDNKISFNELNYIPENLVDLKWEFLIDSRWNQKIRKITLYNLDKLSKSFYNTFWKKLKIVSAYRSYEHQKRIKDRWCSDLFCAKAGYSEHQSGLAIDFWEASNKKRFEENQELKTYFEWMKDNWYKYWFTNTYQKWVKIDGYAVEPWHWRYIWIELATYLKKEQITFAEFYYKNIKK